jgi:ribose/xylose/arabinose/galactoside ABC-type transport system permease subunit
MNSRRFNWPLWSGLALSIVAFLSYFFLFARFPLTRDVPWASLILFAIAVALLIGGVARARRKVLPSIVALAGIGIAVFFCLAVFVGTRLPPSPRAPAVGKKAPDFVLPDTNHHPVALAQLLGAPGTRAVALIFYRGYW